MIPKWGYCLIALGVAAVIVIIPCVICCFQAVDVGYYGLKYNTIKKKLTSQEVFDAGRYNIGLFNEFRMFPSTVQSVVIDDLKVTTTESSFEFDITVTFRINHDEVGELYTKYQTFDTYKTKLSQAITSKITSESSQLKYDDFYKKRKETEQELSDAVAVSLSEFYATLDHFYMRSVTYTPATEKTILDGRLATLNSRLTAKKTEVNAVDAETKQLVTETNKKVSEITANTEAEIRKYKSEKQAEVLQLKNQVDTNSVSFFISDDTKRTFVKKGWLNPTPEEEEMTLAGFYIRLINGDIPISGATCNGTNSESLDCKPLNNCDPETEKCEYPEGCVYDCLELMPPFSNVGDYVTYAKNKTILEKLRSGQAHLALGI